MAVDIIPPVPRNKAYRRSVTVSAQNIELFKRDDEDWVRFQLAVEGEQEGKRLELPVVRIRKIKRRAADA